MRMRSSTEGVRIIDHRVEHSKSSRDKTARRLRSVILMQVTAEVLWVPSQVLCNANFSSPSCVCFPPQLRSGVGVNHILLLLRGCYKKGFLEVK